MKDSLRRAINGSVIVGVAFAAGWFLSPQAEVVGLVQAKRESWALDALPRRTDQTVWAARALSASYWGALAAPTADAAGPAEDRSWRVSAIFGAGQERKLMVSFRNPSLPARTIKVGEKLPSGHVVTQIGERDYCVRVGDGIFRLGVERSEQ
jgi:hypothetical protein